MFVERVRRLQEAGFSATQLDDLLRPPVSGSITRKQMEERAVDVLEDLRHNLRQLTDEYDALDPSNDTQGDLLRRKLGLLNWNSSLVDDVITTLSGTMVYEAHLNVLPNNLLLPNADRPISVDLVPPTGVTVSIPTELRDTVSYNAPTTKLVATRFLNASERALLLNSATDTTVTIAFNKLFAEQDAFDGEIRYDTVKHVLRFIGPMTVARKARLDKTPNGNLAYLKAVDALYNVPRRFIQRHMPTFILRKFSENLSALPAAVKFPSALKDKIYFDKSSTPSQLHVVGALTTVERDALLALSTNADPNHSAYITVINSLFPQADTLVASSSDTFLTAAGTGNHASALFDLTTTAGKRFA